MCVNVLIRTCTLCHFCLVSTKHRSMMMRLQHSFLLHPPYGLFHHQGNGFWPFFLDFHASSIGKKIVVDFVVKWFWEHKVIFCRDRSALCSLTQISSKIKQTSCGMLLNALRRVWRNHEHCVDCDQLRQPCRSRDVTEACQVESSCQSVAVPL